MRKPSERGSRRNRNEAAAAPTARPEVIAPELDRFLSALDALAAIFEEETALVRKGETKAVDAFIQRKREAELEIKGAGVSMQDAGITLPDQGPFAARAQATVDGLAEAARRNGATLAAAREAVDHVMSTIRKAASEAGSEGMYARSGRQVEGFSRTMQGFDRKL